MPPPSGIVNSLKAMISMRMKMIKNSETTHLVMLALAASQQTPFATAIQKGTHKRFSHRHSVFHPNQ